MLGSCQSASFGVLGSLAKAGANLANVAAIFPKSKFYFITVTGRDAPKLVILGFLSQILPSYIRLLFFACSFFKKSFVVLAFAANMIRKAKRL